MRRWVAGMVAVVVLGACASSATQPASGVKEGDPATVNRDCKLLGTVAGRSVFGGSEESRRDSAMNDARAKAAALGATHVVFVNVDNSGMLNTGHATARAYRCPAGP
ncbi:MAG: DUF4156 domain-containing protein [Burkholderiales bacterium]